ncbi:MAG: lipid-A-disaccharide synthase N-terminal domain-containing protein [Parachlamydiaceae bacterium]|nr:MAG: lipid-A-disaccharide synthase N-terminal domain-containing protein [Parachlamydiaceae bacterium]
MREFLYPLGFLSSLAFGARFIVQWLKSEIHKKALSLLLLEVIPRWKYSAFFHSFIQMQFHVCLIQVVNGVISWRNLNLMQAPSRHFKTHSVLFLLLAFLAITVIAFLAQDLIFLKAIAGFGFPPIPGIQIHYLLIMYGIFWICRLNSF